MHKCQQLKSIYNELLAKRDEFAVLRMRREPQGKSLPISDFEEQVAGLLYKLDDFLFDGKNYEQKRKLYRKINLGVVREVMKKFDDRDSDFFIGERTFSNVMPLTDPGNKRAEFIAKVLTHPRNRFRGFQTPGFPVSAAALEKIMSAMNSDYCGVISLDFADAKLTPESLDLICDELKSPGNAIQQLDLRSNELGDAGAEKIADALQSSYCNLRDLNLRSTGIGDPGVEALIAVLPNAATLRGLDLHGNPKISAKIVEELREKFVISI